jgi:hypothetical protein
MISDKLLINLKILSKLQKNGRITRSQNGIISLDNNNLLQPLRRFVCNDSRRQSVFEINSIINEAIDIFEIILNSKYMNKNFHKSEEYIKGCEELELLLDEFKNAKNGIDNLKFTYQNDHNIASQLDIVLLKINTTIKDINNKLNNLKVFLNKSNSIPINSHELNSENKNSPSQFYMEQESPPQLEYTHNSEYGDDIP